MSDTVAMPGNDVIKAEGQFGSWQVPEFKLSGVFSSDMVLQRGRTIRIWGFSRLEGETVEGCFDGEIASAKVKNGRFDLEFSPREASHAPKTLEVRDNSGHKAALDGILIGDVWLLGGQSNMELNLAPCAAYAGEPEFSEEAPFRLFMQTQAYSASRKDLLGEPQPDVINEDWRWRKPGREASLRFSAIGWYVADELARKTGVPIGAINISAGGACLRELMPKELAHRLNYFSGANVPEAGYFNTLISPFCGLPVRGQIFFQGESEGIWRDMAERYGYELAMTVSDERRRFGSDFPFYNVQLSDYRSEGKQYFQFLEIVRLSQFEALSLIPDSCLTVAMDLGSPEGYPDFAHSPRKQQLSARIAALILAREYGIGNEEAAQSPVPFEAELLKDRKTVRVRFRNVSGGLQTLDGVDEVAGFSFGGYDALTPAEARISGPAEVEVTVPDGVSAARVNYAFSSRITPANANLIKAGGLPCPAFSLEIPASNE